MTRRIGRAVLLSFLVVLGLTGSRGQARGDEPAFFTQQIFKPEHKHHHASCLIETTPGRFLATWYSGSGERRSDDVLIQGSWLLPDRKAWGPLFLMADTPEYPDCNPALFHGNDEIWLFWPTILDHRWEGALLKYQVGRQTESLDSLSWTRSGVLHVTPKSDAFVTVIEKAIKTLSAAETDRYRGELEPFVARSKDLLYQRLGWMPRVHVLALPGDATVKHPGRWLLPLYCDTFSTSLMAISDDQGKTWKTGQAMVGFGNIQPSLVRKNDGTLVAYMRDNGPHNRIRLSTSADEGETWTDVVDTALPNPGAGIEAIRLANGNWALIYNDTPRGRHSLAVSLSDDEGQTWKWTRHLEQQEPGKGSYHYPSLIQGTAGDLHATYTYHTDPEGSTITYARFNEAWIRQGDARK